MVIFMLLTALFWGGEAGGDAAGRLQQLFAEDWAYQLAEDPFLATSVGHHSTNDRLPSVTEEDQARRYVDQGRFMARLKSIDPADLQVRDRVNYELFKRDLWDRLAQFEFKAYLIPFYADSGFHTQFARLPSQTPFKRTEDYRAYIKRLLAFPAYVDQHLALLREGLRLGMTLPRVVVKGLEPSMSGHSVSDPSRSLFYRPFEQFPAGVPETSRQALIDLGKQAIMQGVVVGYDRLLHFMKNEYLPAARTSIGASQLPRGRDYYRQRVNYFTTLAIDEDSVHRQGLAEVARIRKEMEAIIVEVGFEGGFADFLQFLRTDPQFYAETAEELLKQAAYIAKRMDAQLPRLFNKFPRLPYGVAPVPDHLAPNYTAGRYVGPAEGSTEPGYYWVNTHGLKSRPLYALEALTLHEAVPGHHFQISLSREMGAVPNFRRYSYISAFGEGWGLYSERLGLEVGFYSDPYSNFGRLTYEMWRACRLVVDTGLHAKGWTRQRALDYLVSNTALSLHECRTETDRYIAWPAQALSYKIGEIKIRQLRARAEKMLGERFDLRGFHDKLLENGSVTLPILERIIEEYIEGIKITEP